MAQMKNTQLLKKQKLTNGNTKPIKSPNDKTNKKEQSDVNYLTKDVDEVMQFREDNNITVDNEPKGMYYKPILSFKEAGFPEDILHGTENFVKPTPIQSQSWPILLSKKDAVGIAETGSGKTLAFGLPALKHIKNLPHSKTPLVLVLAPTRELAQQTTEVLHLSGEKSNINVFCIYGGISKTDQYKALRKGLQVIVATPGRLLDLVQEGECDLSKVCFVVLDEADRMLDLGFEKEIRTILSYLPPPDKRQTLMFSATWPVSIQDLASQFQRNPVKITIGSESLSANNNIEQIVEVIEEKAREARLLELLKKYHSSRKNKVLIFVLYKKEAPFLENYLNRRGWKAISIHGDKNQLQRNEALRSFINGSCPLLIATDVAARGLDIPKVEYVINYSFPLTIEDYVHRIGRTGRAGATGISHTFFQKHNKALTGELVHILKQAKQVVPEELLAFGIATKKKEPKLGRIEANSSASKHITFDSDEED